LDYPLINWVLFPSNGAMGKIKRANGAMQILKGANIC